MSDTPRPRDIANEAESMVVSLPQQITSFLLQLMLPEDGTDRAAFLQKQLGRLTASQAYLTERFETEYVAAADGISDELEEACRELRSTLSGLNGSLPTSCEQAAAANIRGLAEKAETSVAPRVATFLGALFDHVVAWEKASAKRAQDVDSSALGEIDMISRKINFIAVNASVEAARVGDAGRGFAVIAAEIKELSQKSKDAVYRMRAELG